MKKKKRKEEIKVAKESESETEVKGRNRSFPTRITILHNFIETKLIRELLIVL